MVVQMCNLLMNHKQIVHDVDGNEEQVNSDGAETHSEDAEGEGAGHRIRRSNTSKAADRKLGRCGIGNQE